MNYRTILGCTNGRSARTASVVLAAITLQSSSFANGIYREGTGPRAMSLAGADVAWAEDALGPMALNPAGLARLNSPILDLSLSGAYARGEFSNPANANTKLDVLGGMPEAAFALPIKDSPVTLGFSVIPEAARKVSWNYFDSPQVTPGIFGPVNYGFQAHDAQIVVIRSAFGAGVKLGDKWSFGVSVGALYNQNSLKTPYVFQSHPALAGSKTLFDLNTDGWGVDAQFGALYAPTTNLQFGVAYKMASAINADGDASGDVGPQLGLPSVPFHYDAEVRNHFPQMVSAGASWQLHPQWRVALQTDWIGWSDAFNKLPVALKNGSSAAINAALGTSSLNDNVPLGWKDEWVFRTGVEYSATEALKFRVGYAYSPSPVPSSTLTPMTAVISDHVFGAGVGYQWGRCRFDLAYQWQLPASRSVGTSGLLAGEYNNSRVETSIHWLSLGTSIRF